MPNQVSPPKESRSRVIRIEPSPGTIIAVEISTDRHKEENSLPSKTDAPGSEEIDPI